jgi:hypothetical protein
MSRVVSLGKKTESRIVVKKGDTIYYAPYWISKKGNLCWRINNILYVKLQSGFVMMLENGEWIPADAETEALAPGKPEPAPEYIKRFEFPTEV